MPCSGNAVAVGVEGGMVMSDDGKLTLEIPPGALDEEVAIAVTAISVDELPEPLGEEVNEGPAYRLEPDGLVFNAPAAVILRLGPDDLATAPDGTVAGCILLTQTAAGEFEPLDATTMQASLGEGGVVADRKFKLRFLT